MRFIDTPLGHWFALHAPYELQLVNESVFNNDKGGRNALVAATEIELIAYHSTNPAFRTPDFRKLLATFRTNGLYTKKKLEWTVDDAVEVALNRQAMNMMGKQGKS